MSIRRLYLKQALHTLKVVTILRNTVTQKTSQPAKYNLVRHQAEQKTNQLVNCKAAHRRAQQSKPQPGIQMVLIGLSSLMFMACQTINPIVPTPLASETPVVATSTEFPGSSFGESDNRVSPTIHTMEPTMTTAGPIITEADLSEDQLDHTFLYPDTPECQLPCWHGLRIGESTVDEFRAVVLEQMGSHEPFVAPQEDTTLESGWWHIVDQIHPTGEGLIVGARYNNSDHQLTEIMFLPSSISLDRQISPASLISELGPPSFVALVLRQTERVDILGASVRIGYNSGIYASYNLFLPVEVETNDEGDVISAVATLCFGYSWWEANSEEGGKLSLIEPYDGFDYIAENNGLNPDLAIMIEELFDIQPQDLTPDTCLQADINS